jgi:hypothetical protein
MNGSLLGSLFLVLAVLNSGATTYWVAPYGSDSNNGTSSNTPFATPQKAVTLSALAPGDTIYVRGGTYALDTAVKPSKTGTAGNYIKLWAYPGEKPVLDFATTSDGVKALDLRRDYWHVKGIEIVHSTDNGIYVGGSSGGTAGFITVEGCVIHDCDNDGLVLGSTTSTAHDVLILNCDSYRNFQVSSSGNNGDGFAAKEGCGTNNVFRGCRAWHNADDGWDFYNNASNSVTLENCWAFWNGSNLWNVANFTGNGNGFKLGGAGAKITFVNHLLKNCVTFDNQSKGFDHNHSHGGQAMYNCTGFRNGGANFSFYDAPEVGTNVLKNNISYLGGGVDLHATSVQVSNSWQIATVTAADFVSLDTSIATTARNPDFSLPTNNLFRLAAGSDLIDRGQDVGLPFNGSAPDLGAFEFFASAPPQGPILLSVPQKTAGGFHFQVGGLTSHGPVVIHASSNLMSWSPILTSAPVTGVLPVTDSSATNHALRFYRALEL